MTSSPLGHRFWRLWASFTAANLGDGFTLVAFPLLAVSLTDDARLIAFVTMCRFLAFPLLGLPVGVIIDRFDRRWLAIAAQTGRGAAIGFVALFAWADTATIPLLAAAAFIVGVAKSSPTAGSRRSWNRTNSSWQTVDSLPARPWPTCSSVLHSLPSSSGWIQRCLSSVQRFSTPSPSHCSPRCGAASDPKLRSTTGRCVKASHEA